MALSLALLRACEALITQNWTLIPAWLVRAWRFVGGHLEGVNAGLTFSA